MSKTKSRLTSIGKALTWRCVALVCTAVTAYWLTGSAEAAITIGLADSVLKIGLYYAHERAWA